MEDENEYKKLPTEEKCVHKLWKARKAGYEEAIKLFNQIDDDKSPEWNKYLGLIKKFVTDSNVVAQEKGMEAALVFVENCGHAGKTVGEVMSGVVAKCLAAPKAKTKDLALQITLMYVEIEKHETVEEELIKGMEQKNPKVVAASISALTTALKLFGNKVIAIKPMVKKIPILLADRDKTVRDEMKALVVEMHRWIGAAIEGHIASLQTVVQQELREGFSAAGSAQPARYLRSQQPRAAAQPSAGDGSEEDDETEAAGGDNADVDPYDLLDPVDILSKLPKDFYDKLEAKKWQDRKEALDALDNLLKNAPKLEPGDYADLVRALKKVVSKDLNVILVGQGTRLLGLVASGLRARFQPYAVACVGAILEKFKEKKPNVVTALREAVDAMYPSTNLEALLEDMLAAFDNKNPSVRSESALFLSRALSVTQPAAFSKKLIKPYVGGLVKLLDSADPAVREAAAEALGTATKLAGEKAVAPHIGIIDSLKEQKIKEYADKATLHVKVLGSKKAGAGAGAAAPSAKGDTKVAGSAQPKPVKRPTTGGGKKVAVKKPPRPQNGMPCELELSQEAVDEAAAQLFMPEIIAGMVDSDWKCRLRAVQGFHSNARCFLESEASAQLLYRILNRKPGLRDTNVQVLKARLDACKCISENYPVSVVAADFVLHDVTSKLGESTCTSAAADALTALAQAAGPEHVLNEALTYAMDMQKSPKVQWEVFNWMATAIKEFGFNMKPTTIISHCKKALSATNPSVRNAAVGFLGVLSMYVGPSLITMFDGEKVAARQMIAAEVDKYANRTAPAPTRKVAGAPGTVSKSASKGSMVSESEEAEEEAEEGAGGAADTRPPTDLAPLITDALQAEISDKNWKVRNEGLEKVRALIVSSAPLKASLGELPAALAPRLLDSNSKLAQSALNICEALATAMGPRSKVHARTFFPAFFQALGDSKQWVRSAAVSCMETWCREAGAAAPLDGEMLHDALKAGSPQLRATLLLWLAEHLPNVPVKSFPKEELSMCLPILYSCVEDRSADVRKAANDCVLPFMLHLGYEPMQKTLDKLKPGSKSVIQAALEKARPSLPVQPLPTKAKKDEGKGVKTAGAGKREGERKTPPVKGKVSSKPSSASIRGKKEEDDCTPLLPQNNSKNQRIIDDQKMKVLKWNFTTPREEFFDLLKEQMTNAGCNKQLVANMFHNDFRYHLKAIEALSEDLQDNGPALMCNLDLVLKWLTLRFFDTNPTVILKGLEYLSAVFNYLMDSRYTMAEYEANCFIPYLVLKVGDPKDSVRNGVKALFKQICVVYSVTKLFGYLMEGLKSKNARQRAECLECIGHLVETYGSGVMAPTAAVALKELARHIGDRDNAVRSAALNCIANAYFLEGDKVYKMIGQISDKDLSLLEERIKRAGKSRSAETRRSTLVPLSASGKPVLPEETVPRREISVERPVVSDYEEEADEPPLPPVQTPPPEPKSTKVVLGPFGLDPTLIARLDAAVPAVPVLNLPEIDLGFLDEPVPAPGAPARALARPLVANGTHGVVPPSPARPPHPLVSAAPPAAVDDLLLADTIHSIASPDLNAGIRALSLVSNSLARGRGNALGAHEDALCAAVAALVRRLRAQHPPSPQALEAYKYLAGTLTNFYEVGGCGLHVRESSLCALLGELLRVLGAGAGAGAAAGPCDGNGGRLARILNNVCVRVLEHSQHTHLLCAIVSLLHESIGAPEPAYPRYQDLLLKCFWKTLKMISAWEHNSIEYEAVLYKIHLFYKAYPNSFWKKNPDINDTPYRTVKTLVHTLVKMKGAAITNYLSRVPNANESDLYPYLLKVIKQLKLDCDDKKENWSELANGGHLVSHATLPGHHRLPRGVHEELAAILKRIGSKDHNQDALQQLYDLRERQPDVDIWTFMQGSSFYFRNYVERGLRDVAEQRKLGAAALFKQGYHNDHIDISNENDEKSHVIFLERLRALQCKAGMKCAGPGAQSPPGAAPAHDTRTHCLDPQLEIHTSQPSSQRNEAAVDALRLKLQQIKSKR